MLFAVTEAIKEPRNQQLLKAYLAEKMTLPSYARFLSYKGLVDAVPGDHEVAHAGLGRRRGAAAGAPGLAVVAHRREGWIAQ